MPMGVDPSADPLLVARAVPYAVSLGRRLVESTKQPGHVPTQRGGANDRAALSVVCTINSVVIEAMH